MAGVLWLTKTVSVAQGQGSAHGGEKEIPSQLEAGSQFDKLLFAYAWILNFCEKKCCSLWWNQEEHVFKCIHLSCIDIFKWHNEKEK